MSDIYATDPMVRANLGGLVENNDPQEDLSAFLPHAVNKLALNLPQGIVENKPFAMKVNSFLGGLPEQLIEATGGKEKLKKQLGKTSALGDLAGSIAPALLPVGKLGAVGKAITSPLGMAATQAGAAGLSAANMGENPILPMAVGGVMGGAGGALGKVMSKAAAPIKAAPQEALEGLADSAARANFKARSGIPSGKIGQFYSRKLESGGAQDVAEELAKVGKIADKEGLYDAANLAKYKATTKSMWAPVDEAVLKDGFVPVAMEKDLLDGPAVKAFMDKEKSNMNGASKKIRDVLDRASGIIKHQEADGTILQHQAPMKFSDVRQFLADVRDSAYKSIDNSMAAPGVAGTASSDFRDLAHAGDEIRDSYTKAAMDKYAASNPNLYKDLMLRTKVEMLGEMSQAARTKGLGEIMSGETPMLRSNPLSVFRNILARVTGGVTNKLGEKATEKVTGGIMRNVGTKGTLGNDLGKLGIAALPGANASNFYGNVGGQVGRIPGMGGGAGDGGEDSPPMGIGSGGSGMAPQPPNPLAQASGVQPGKPGETQNMSPEAQSLALKYNYQPSGMDDAVLRGIDTLFQQNYRGRYDENPQMGKEALERFRKGALDALHNQPGRALNTVTAAKVLFPGRAADQAAFTKAAQENLAIQKSMAAFDVGAPVVGGLLRYMNPQKAAAYANLRSIVSREAGESGAAQFDKIMNGMVRGDRVGAVRKLIANSSGPNAYGWQLFSNALGGR